MRRRERREVDGIGLCRREPLARHPALAGYRPLLDREQGLAGHPVEGEHSRHLGDLDRRLAHAAIDRDIGQDRRGRQIVVPQVVVDRLIVPDLFTGLGVQGDQGVGVQVIPEARPAVVVVIGRAQRHIDIAQLLVGAKRRPGLGFAARAPGVVFPGLDSGLSRVRHGVEGPEQRARARVVTANVAGQRGRGAAVDAGGGRLAADNDDVAQDERCGRIPDEGRRGVWPQIDAALVAKALHESAGLAVQQIEIGAANGDNALGVALAPEGYAAAGVRRRQRAVPLVDGLAPEDSSIAGIASLDLAGQVADEHDAVNDERRAAEVVRKHQIGVGRPQGRIDGRGAPDNLQAADVARVDLIERRVLGVADIAAEMRPVRLGLGKRRRRKQGQGERDARGFQNFHCA